MLERAKHEFPNVVSQPAVKWKKGDSKSAVGKGGQERAFERIRVLFRDESGHGIRVLDGACARWAMRMSRTFEAAVRAGLSTCFFLAGQNRTATILLPGRPGDDAGACRACPETPQIDTGIKITCLLASHACAAINHSNLVADWRVSWSSHACGAITIHQQRYTEDLLAEFGMANAKLVHTPAEPGVELRRAAAGDAGWRRRRHVLCLGGGLRDSGLQGAGPRHRSAVHEEQLAGRAAECVLAPHHVPRYLGGGVAQVNQIAN